MEKSAKLILKERRYESNAKRHEKFQAAEQSFRREAFMTINEHRSQRRQHTIDHDAKLDRLGVERYKKDTKDVEEYIEKVQQKELQRARESYLKLQRSIEQTEQKQKEAEETFNMQADEAKQTLISIERDIKQR